MKGETPFPFDVKRLLIADATEPVEKETDGRE